MRKIRISRMGIVMLSVVSVLSGQDPSAQRLVVTEKDGAYNLVVPVSRLSLTIPKGQLVPSAPNASGNPRYFSFEDRGSALIISGWFEPEQAFKGMDAFWAGEQRSLSQNRIQIQNVTRERIETWQAVLYDIRLPGGRSSNMRAEWVQAGTWIDLHLSVTTNQSEAEGRNALRDALKTIQVIETKQ